MKIVISLVLSVLVGALLLSFVLGGAFSTKEEVAREGGFAESDIAAAQQEGAVELDNRVGVLPEEVEEEKIFHPDSMDALSQKDFDGSDLRIGRVLAENSLYTRYYITYKSEGLTISGILNIPKEETQGPGPYPVLFLNHGYIYPPIYTNGRGLKREQDYFARNGYAVLHSDYRGHAESDPDPYRDIRPRTGYTEDVINAMYAVQRSDITSLDKSRFGTLGHSMGGGVVQNIMVIKPDLAKAHVLYAPISPLYQDNFERYVRAENDPETNEILQTYGEPEENSEYWKSVSALYYFDRITAPIEIHHAPTDRDVPYVWSLQTEELLRAAGKEITLHTYENEGHEFGPAWELFMQRSVAFFDKHVK